MQQDLKNFRLSWINNFEVKKPGFGKDPFDLYVLTSNFAVATVTTVG